MQGVVALQFDNQELRLLLHGQRYVAQQRHQLYADFSNPMAPTKRPETYRVKTPLNPKPYSFEIMGSLREGVLRGVYNPIIADSPIMRILGKKSQLCPRLC